MTHCSVFKGLDKSFVGPNGRLCDASGFLDPTKARRVYMVAGLLAPSTDEALPASIVKNTHLLNSFLQSVQLAPVNRRAKADLVAGGARPLGAVRSSKVKRNRSRKKSKGHKPR